MGPPKKSSAGGAAAPTARRSTAQVRAVWQAFVDEDRPLGPAEACAAAQRACPGLGLATAYRAIRRLQADGALVAVSVVGQAPRYETAGRGHHHHFHCTRCDRLFEVPGCRQGLHTLAPRGFAVHAHEVLLSGSCVACV